MSDPVAPPALVSIPLESVRLIIQGLELGATYAAGLSGQMNPSPARTEVLGGAANLRTLATRVRAMVDPGPIDALLAVQPCPARPDLAYVARFKRLLAQGTLRAPDPVSVQPPVTDEMARALAPCECEFDPYEGAEAGEESCHYRRTCLSCGHVWWGLHCPHDGHQNPCTGCGVRPHPVPESDTPMTSLPFPPPHEGLRGPCADELYARLYRLLAEHHPQARIRRLILRMFGVRQVRIYWSQATLLPPEWYDFDPGEAATTCELAAASILAEMGRRISGQP